MICVAGGAPAMPLAPQAKAISTRPKGPKSASISVPIGHTNGRMKLPDRMICPGSMLWSYSAVRAGKPDHAFNGVVQHACAQNGFFDAAFARRGRPDLALRQHDRPTDRCVRLHHHCALKGLLDCISMGHVHFGQASGRQSDLPAGLFGLQRISRSLRLVLRRHVDSSATVLRKMQMPDCS